MKSKSAKKIDSKKSTKTIPSKPVASKPTKTAAPASKPTVATAAKTTTTTPKVATPKPKKTLALCTCGCGAQTLSRFLPGHDARLHGLCLRIYRKQANLSELPKGERTTTYLMTAPWATVEMLSALGLAGRKPKG